MTAMVLLLFLLLFGASLPCAAIAARESKSRLRYGFLGILDGRANFSPRGWRFRNWALGLQGVAFLLLLAWALWTRQRFREGGGRSDSLASVLADSG
jgi:hypothetical protein